MVIRLYELISRLPIKYLYMIGNLVTILEYIPFNPIRKRITHNLKVIYPSISNQDIIVIRKKLFKSLGQYAAEFVKFIHDKDEIRIEVSNPEKLKQSIRDNEITICLTGHFTGFEFYTTIPRFFKGGNFIFLFEADPDFEVFNSWICKKRDRGGGTTISSKEIYRVLLKKIFAENHSIIGSLSDLSPTFNSSIGIFQFLNKKRRIYTGLQRIGYKLNAHFIYVEIERKCKGNYILCFHDLPSTTIREVTTSYLKLLQENITNAPELWLPMIMYDL